MENPLINPHNLIDFPLKPHATPFTKVIVSTIGSGGGSGSSDHGGVSDDDIEMIAFQSMSYTSLKDLMPASPPASLSPTSGSWREIPIKDPLVQHAAWAYLQPMAEARDEDDRWWRRLKKKCCGVLGCLNDVVLVVFNGWSGSGDEYDDGKVD